MKVLIAYSSKTGSTKKVANAIHGYNTDWDIKDIKEIVDIEQLDSYDLYFVGGFIDKGTYNKEALDFVKSLKNKNIAFFFTLGACSGSKHAFDCINNIRGLFAENNNNVINHFHCQGAIDEKLIAFMSNLPPEHPHFPDKYRVNRWNDAKNHPNEEDLRAFEAFADSTCKIFRETEKKDV